VFARGARSVLEDTSMHISRRLASAAWLHPPAGGLRCCSDNGGGSDSASAATPQFKLTVASTEIFRARMARSAPTSVHRLALGEVDPKARHNAIIQDLRAGTGEQPRMVEYTAEFVMLKPKDMSKATGCCATTHRTAATS
jgi:hypothetical protein